MKTALMYIVICGVVWTFAATVMIAIGWPVMVSAVGGGLAAVGLVYEVAQLRGNRK